MPVIYGARVYHPSFAKAANENDEAYFASFACRSSQQYGAVDVCLNGAWGSICSDYWDNNDASVICRQLGYSPYGALGPAVTQTSSSTPSHNIIDLNCTGQESSILDCPFNGLIGQYSCSNTRDANAYCQDSNLVTYSNCTDGQMRLVNGSNEYQGRVEVCVNGAWGTVCSTSWSSTDAKVVCRYMGALTIGYQYSRVTTYGFNYGHGPILLGYLYCSGQEQSLIDCNQNYYGTNSASTCKQHSYDAAVICEPYCTNGTVRLRGGSYTHGRVELCVNEIWTTICSDHWNYKDSSVVCNQLGYSFYGAVPASGYYSEYVWAVGIINPNCTGNETSILNCSHNQTGSCSPSHDASVICQNVTVEPVSCVTGDIRLVGGSTGNEGRLEVCINEMWGTVCSRSWGSSDTRVACKQLGHQELGGVQYGSSQYGQGTGPVFLGYMYCAGSEDSLIECRRSVFTVVNSQCSSHYYDIGLKCEPICEHSAVRLQGGTLSTGRVEVCVNGTWGTVCSDFWDNNDASVICNQLGYSPYGAIAVSGYYSTSVWPHHIIDLNCTGTEAEILNCSYNGGHHTCLTNNDASVVCQSVDIQKDDCVDGDIRLAGGQTEYEGRVEICINKVWGTICGYGRRGWWWSYYNRWSTPDSNVVCTQLGHMELGSTAYYRASQFGQGSGPIFLSEVDCQGNEQNLLSCPYRPIHSTSCTHNYDAGVKCEAPCVNGTVRLYSESGSYFRRYGRVQVCINNAWGTVCDHFWDEQDASVVCKMLGYSSYGASALTDTFTEGVWYVHINDLNCTGNESSIWDCPMNSLSSYSCGSYDDAAVVCQLPNVINSDCTTNELRLTGGENKYEGRVEYCVNGVWQSFCDYYWDDSDAYTVCKQLGYQGGRRVLNSHFGIGVTPLSIYYLSCQYNSANLSQCTWNMLPSYSYCNNYQEAGVICEALCTDGSIDLFGTSLVNVGNVRVCINGSWNKVCGSGSTLLDNELASIACFSAGFSKYGATSFRGQWSDRKYPFKFYNMKCYGNESNLHECDYDTQGTCSIYYALGVSCQQGFITSPVNCTDNDIKLFSENSDNRGIVLICKNGAWTRVCTNNYYYYYWPSSNTDVVCRQLGYTVYGNTYRQVFYQQAYPTAFIRFSCRGSETSLSSCRSYLYFSTPQYCHRTIEITCAEPCTTGDTQLIGSHYYGRVEVCLGGVWGTICRDSFWDNTDASVVCKQLGFSPYGAIAVPINWYSISTKFNFAGGVSCSGNETHILECPFNSSLSCPSSNDANVICPVHSSTYSNCTDGDIKLLNGSTEYEGRVEICINKAWGTITYFYGTSNEAQTVCNQLGYTAPGARRLNNAYFGEGSSPVLLTYVYCSTPKNSLMNCSIRHTTWRANYRDRNSVISVRCQTYCQHGSIRLTGLDPLQGRVEVCVNGTWGSVCNDYWHNNDARVVCRQLGFPSEGAIARVINYYGTSPSFHIIDLNCNGTEATVLNCSYNNIEQHSCQWYEDAYVQCQVPNTTDNCTNGVIRLVKGEAKNEGLVEICADGSWGYVCPNYRWGQNEAMVTCRQLGYTATGARTSSSFGKGAGPVHFSSFYCSGNENNLLDCSHYTASCSYSYHAGVICQAPCNEGDIRLQGDRRYNSFGRVEVCNGDTWGTICDDYWDNSDASVICKQLGFSPYGAIAKTSFYSEYRLPHIIFNMSCNGDEESIFNCSYSNEVPTGSNCHPTEDASVICQDIKVTHSNCIDYDVKLVGGETGNEGKVLMCLNGVWGTLCDNGFNTNDAGVVCNNAGYSKRGSRYSANFPNSSNEILLVADMYCSSTDERIEDCSVTHYTPPSTCDVLDIVAVRCHNCTDGDIRIIPYGSITTSVGRVEVCSDSSWGTICNDFFDHADAQVFCRQLGYSAIGSVSVGPLNDNLHYYHIIDINCTGTESNIQDCPSNNLTTCPTNRDAGVSCNSISLINYTNCTDGELRLAGGTELSGRVEICYNRIWYGICSDNYNRYSTPNTICKGLGYSSQDAVGSIVETYPPLPLLPFEFNCYGNRETLWDCYKSTIQCSNGPYRYAAVTCQTKCNDWEVRLYGSSFENIGAVEVCIDGEWSSVCYDDFDFSDAAAVCTQLGYIPYGAIILPRYSYYRYTRIYYISDLNCTGDERTVQNCSYTAPKKGNCVNTPLICQRNNESVDATCTDGSVRLVGGINELEGNVEICLNKFWGSVCHSGWNTIDANIACKQLGHQPSGKKISTNITAHHLSF
uniref:SRCR domain-containing protein n=1 Tax=Amphimedon queenslandica TaxID=400682 RepID=A0A1X7U210_AMPQE